MEHEDNVVAFDDDDHHGWIQHKSTNRRFEVTSVHAWDHVQARMYSSIKYHHHHYPKYILNTIITPLLDMLHYMIIFQLLHSNT